MARKNKELEDELNRSIRDKLGMFGESQLKKVEKNAKEEQKMLEAKNIELSSEIEILKNQLNNERSLIGEH